MRPAVLLFSLLLLVPLLACESGLTEPMPDESVADLQQPLSVEPLFANGTQDQIQGQTQEALKKQDGSCLDAAAAAEAAAVSREAELEGQHTETQARTRKGDGTAATADAKVKMRKQYRGRT